MVTGGLLVVLSWAGVHHSRHCGSDPTELYLHGVGCMGQREGKMTANYSIRLKIVDTQNDFNVRTKKLRFSYYCSLHLSS